MIFGNEMMHDFLKNKDVVIKDDVNNNLEKITEYILMSENCSLDSVEKHISFIISQKIFFKLAQCRIIERGDDYGDFKELGYEIKEQKLINGYIFLYKYSYSYEDSFNTIYKNNKSFIKKSIVNLLLSYLMKTQSKDKFDEFIHINDLDSYNILAK